MLKAILFDLDGTLLPSEQDEFTAKYFEALAAYHTRCGNDTKHIVDCVLKGIVAMFKNKGEDINENVFWRVFEAEFGQSKADIKPVIDAFYASDYDHLKVLCGFTEKANMAVKAAKTYGVPVVLATNPIYPIKAQVKRAEWAGVNPDDFAFITSYENSRYCKPCPEYYIDIANALGCRPEECLMIGNDTTDDMIAAKIGMGVFLITDCLINKTNVDISAFPHGDADKLVEFLSSLEL